MQAGALQPYVRYIHTFSPEGDGKPVIAYDHRIFCVLSGKLGIGYGEESTELAAKDLILIPAGVPYRLYSTESKTLAIGINFDLSDNGREYDPPIAPDSREKYRPERRTEKQDLSLPSELTACRIVRNKPLAAEQLREILREYEEGKLYSREVNSARMKLLLLDLLRASHLPEESASEITDAVIGYIRENYTRPISNEEIGRALNFHPNYLNRLMKRCTGQSIHRYLIGFRLRQATALLQNTNLSVGEIAARTGFTDVQQFSKSFRKSIGIPPGAFRRLI